MDIRFMSTPRRAAAVEEATENMKEELSQAKKLAATTLEMLTETEAARTAAEEKVKGMEHRDGGPVAWPSTDNFVLQTAVD